MKTYRTLIILVIASVLAGLLTQGDFFTARNLTNLTRQVCINGILSIGMTYVILTGGIDLSVGSVAALAGIAAGILQVNFGYGAMGVSGALISILGAVSVGALWGLINGLIIVKSKVVPFIITLGIMVIARGLALILSKGAAIAPLDESFNYLGQGYFSISITIGLLAVATALALLKVFRSHKKNLIHVALILLIAALSAYTFLTYKGIPVPVVLFVLIAFIAHYCLNNTVWGRYVIATGSNLNGAFLSGVPVNKITFFVYLITGTLAGLSGAVLSARLNGAMPTAGDLFELDAIAAVVIGGTKLTGGVGSISGSVLGAFLIGVLNNSMSLLNVDEFYQKVIK